MQTSIKLGTCVSFPHIFQLYILCRRTYLVFPSGQLVPVCVVFPLPFAFFTKGETTDRFLSLWVMFSPTSACWRNVTSKPCVFPRNAFPSAQWAVALLPISCEKAEPFVWQCLGVCMLLQRLCTSNARGCFICLPQLAPC